MDASTRSQNSGGNQSCPGLIVALASNGGCVWVDCGYAGKNMAAVATQLLEDRIRRMTPVSAPADQRADVQALSRLLGGMAHPRKRHAPKCQLVGPRGEHISIPES